LQNSITTQTSIDNQTIFMVNILMKNMKTKLTLKDMQVSIILLNLTGKREGIG